MMIYIRDLIEQLGIIENEYGDLPCVIDACEDDGSYEVIIGRLGVEKIPGYGLSVKFEE